MQEQCAETPCRRCAFGSTLLFFPTGECSEWRRGLPVFVLISGTVFYYFHRFVAQSCGAVLSSPRTQEAQAIVFWFQTRSGSFPFCKKHLPENAHYLFSIQHFSGFSFINPSLFSNVCSAFLRRLWTVLRTLVFHSSQEYHASVRRRQCKNQRNSERLSHKRRQSVRSLYREKMFIGDKVLYISDLKQCLKRRIFPNKKYFFQNIALFSALL